MNYDFKKHISSKIFKVIAYASAELGYKSYVIGGYVRDILLRRPSNDIDVVTVGSGIIVLPIILPYSSVPYSVILRFSTDFAPTLVRRKSEGRTKDERRSIEL